MVEGTDINALKQHILQELHKAHIELSKMEVLARNVCSWRNVERDIEDMGNSCQHCVENHTKYVTTGFSPLG